MTERAQERRQHAASERRQWSRMRESYHLELTQELLQKNWSLYRRRRYRSDLKERPPDGAHLVRWSEPVAVKCGQCRRTIATCVVFRSDDLYGLVDDRAKWYERWFGELPYGVLPGVRKLAFWVEGDGRSAKAFFQCRSCERRFAPRNAHRLGEILWKGEPREIALE